MRSVSLSSYPYLREREANRPFQQPYPSPNHIATVPHSEPINYFPTYRRDRAYDCKFRAEVQDVAVHFQSF